MAAISIKYNEARAVSRLDYGSASAVYMLFIVVIILFIPTQLAIVPSSFRHNDTKSPTMEDSAELKSKYKIIMNQNKTVVSIFGSLFDITDFVANDHPGGLHPTQCYDSIDCTSLFVSIHSIKTITTFLKSKQYLSKIKYIGPSMTPQIKQNPQNYIPFWYKDLKNIILESSERIISEESLDKARKQIAWQSTFQLILYFVIWYIMLSFNITHFLFA
eukprot:34920_1